MYTQCPECQTVFRITEAQLALAGGKVRCGHCLGVFTAREHKVDPVPEAAPPRTAPDRQTATPPAAAAQGSAGPQRSAAPTRPATPAPASRSDSPPKKPVSRVEMEREIERILSEEPTAGAGRKGRPPVKQGEQPTGAGRPGSPIRKSNPAARKRAPGPAAAAAPESRPRNDSSPSRRTPGRGPGQTGGPTGDNGRATRPERTPPKPAERLGPGKKAPEARTASPGAAAPAAPKRPLPVEAAAPGLDTEETALPEQEPLHFSAAEGNAAAEDGEDAPLPAALRQPERTGSGPVAVIFWSLASLLMLALLVAQYGYYERHELVKNATFRPWLERMCVYLDCRLPPRRDTAAFELQERDVRYHPEYAGALLISGTFINRAAFAQPYPTVEVVLKDVNGELVASRRFTPAEYLQAPRGGLLEPHTEAQLLLEVSDPGNQAVSFEFNFL